MLKFTDTGEKIILDAIDKYKSGRNMATADELVAKIETVIALAREADDLIAPKITLTNEGLQVEGLDVPKNAVKTLKEDFCNIAKSDEEPLIDRVHKMRLQKMTISQIAKELHISDKKVRELIKYKRDMDSK